MSIISENTTHLQRIDDSRNMARFYRMSIQPTLFGEVSLIRNWGRIGTSGQEMVRTFEEVAEMERARKRLERGKIGRGYLVV